MRLFSGDLQRGDGFQAGLDALLLPAVPHPQLGGVLRDVLPSCLRPEDGPLPAAAALALDARRALLRGDHGVGAGGGRGGRHLEPPHRNDREQAVGRLLGVKREVAEDVLVLGGGGAAPLILEQHQQNFLENKKKFFAVYFLRIRSFCCFVAADVNKI